MAALERITTHPLVLNGRPCIRGLRVTVANILRLMAAGHSRECILETYPYLESADLDACVAYAAKEEGREPAALESVVLEPVP